MARHRTAVAPSPGPALAPSGAAILTNFGRQTPTSKHGISLLEVNGVMLGYVDDALGDLTFELEEALRSERDDAADLC